MKHCMVDAKSFLVLCKYLTQVEFLWFFLFFPHFRYEAEIENCGWTPNCRGSFRCLPKVRGPGKTALKLCCTRSAAVSQLKREHVTNENESNKLTFKHATRRSNDLHPPKPKYNMGNRTFKYAGTICFNALPACIKSAPSLSNFKSLIIKHFYL